MQPNIGHTDRIIRVVTAILIATLLISGQLLQELDVPATIAALLFLITGITGYCPLYKILKINTRNKIKQNKQTL